MIDAGPGYFDVAIPLQGLDPVSNFLNGNVRRLSDDAIRNIVPGIC
jgi:hypothetical protein